MPYAGPTCDARITTWWDRLFRQPWHYCGRRRVRLHPASGFPTFYCEEHYPKETSA